MNGRHEVMRGITFPIPHQTHFRSGCAPVSASEYLVEHAKTSLAKDINLRAPDRLGRGRVAGRSTTDLPSITSPGQAATAITETHPK